MILVGGKEKFCLVKFINVSIGVSVVFSGEARSLINTSSNSSFSVIYGLSQNRWSCQDALENCPYRNLLPNCKLYMCVSDKSLCCVEFLLLCTCYSVCKLQISSNAFLITSAVFAFLKVSCWVHDLNHEQHYWMVYVLLIYTVFLPTGCLLLL